MCSYKLDKVDGVQYLSLAKFDLMQRYIAKIRFYWKIQVHFHFSTSKTYLLKS